ncbi:transmembrane protein, putative, partial (macronuclear) [Tetrahymena thermophila SB210]
MSAIDKNSQRVMLESFDQSQNLRVLSPMQSPQYSQSQYRTSQIAIQLAKSKLMQSKLQNRQAQEQSIPTDPILLQKLLLRMHPNKYISILFGLMFICSVGYGIFLPANYCAISLVCISAFSFVGFLIETITFCRLKISYQRVSVFYVIKGIYILIAATIHFVFLFAINDATYCDYMWCQQDVTMKDFLKSFTNSVGQSTLSQQCAQFQAQYLGDAQYSQLQQFLLSNIAKYCVYIGKCNSIDDINNLIHGYSTSSNKGYLIAFGIAFVIYSIYLFYFVTHLRHIKSQMDEFNTLDYKDQDKPNLMNPFDESQFQNQSAFQSPHQDFSQIQVHPYNQQQELQQQQQQEINNKNILNGTQSKQKQEQILKEEQQHQKMHVQDLQQEQRGGNYVFDDDANRAKNQNKLQQKVQQVVIISKLAKTKQQQQQQQLYQQQGILDQEKVNKQDQQQNQQNQKQNATNNQQPQNQNSDAFQKINQPQIEMQNSNLKSSQLSNRQQNHILSKISSSKNQQLNIQKKN